MEIRITRRSVCMGDDCFAPHEAFLPYSSEEMLSEWIDKIVEYLPAVKGKTMWKVYCNNCDFLLCYVIGNDGTYRAKLAVADKKVSEMKIEDVHCYYYSEADLNFSERLKEFANEYPEFESSNTTNL